MHNKKIILIVLGIIILLNNCMNRNGGHYNSMHNRNRGLQAGGMLVGLSIISRVVNPSSLSTTTTCANSDVSLTGLILDSATNTPLSEVEVSTIPATISVSSGVDGKFTLNQSLCLGQSYSVVYKKYGYSDKTTIQAIKTTVNDIGAINISKDLNSFTFINILVRDPSNNTVSGASVSYGSGGVVKTNVTGTSGILTVPVSKIATSLIFSVSYQTYKNANGIFNLSAGTCSDTVNGISACSSDSIIIQLQN